MTLASGQRLGPYEILSPLGAGGMGEVYKARDVRLGRSVAIKVLPAELAANPDRLRRFETEARAASSLNHPNIVSLFDVGVEGSVSYLAMELVEGRTLRDMLLSGPLPIKRFLDVAAQIADGMAAAHEAGIVHRDLKPGNIMITKDGFAKILDFGLARRDSPISASGELAASTATSPPTLPGAVLGTVGYMSPEQARGETLDYRSDQFSFGSILYEMATGVRAFQKTSAIETLSAILNAEPAPISKRRPEFPAPLRWVIERCLAKAPGDRYSATRDLARELQGIREHLSEISGADFAPAGPHRRRSGAVLIGAVLGVVLIAGGLWLGLAWNKPAAVTFRRLTLRSGYVMRGLFVPRSNSILYTAAWDGAAVASFLTLPEAKGIDRRVDSPAQLPMAYTEDGSEVLVLLGGARATVNPIGKLAWWPALGGKPRPIVEDAGWADWARRGRFLAAVRTAGSERVLDIREPSGVLRKTLFRTSGAISWVRISPDEKRVAFIHHRSRFDDAGEVRIANADGSGELSISPIFERCRGLAWNTATGDVWFTASKESVDSTTLWAATTRGRLTPLHAFPDFLSLQDVSGDACLLIGETWNMRLFVHREGGSISELSWLGSSFVSDLSHDGKNVLFIDGTSANGTLGTWVRSIDGGDAIRIADGELATFSPDDQSVVTTTHERDRPPQLELVSVAGGSVRLLTHSTFANSSPSFLSNDAILFARTSGGRESEVWRLALADGQERRIASGCDRPSADPTGTSFLCLGGLQDNTLFTGSLRPGSESAGGLRTIEALTGGNRFVSARWDASGKKIYGVTTGLRVMELDAVTGATLRESPIPLPESIGSHSVLSSAFSDDARVQAYSVSHLSSSLYLLRRP